MHSNAGHSNADYDLYLEKCNPESKFFIMLLGILEIQFTAQRI